MRVPVCILALCLCLLPVGAQTTGVPGVNDLTLDGVGSGSTSCTTHYVLAGGHILNMGITAASGDNVIIATSQNCAAGTLPIPGSTTSLDLSLTGFTILLNGTDPTSPFYPYGTVLPAGNWGLSIATNFPQGSPVLAVQGALVGPNHPGGLSTTQAYDIAAVVNNCTIQAMTGPTGDDTYVNVVFTSGPFPFYGVSYNDIWINSNGNLTFTSGDSDFTSSEAEMLSDQPRIAPCWDDFSPNISGSVTYTEGGGVMTVTWDQVPHYAAGASDTNTFCCSLLFTNGDIAFDWYILTLNGGSSIDQVVGISPGLNVSSPNNIDINGGPHTAPSPTAAIYEDFSQFVYSSSFDLQYQNAMFMPTGGPGIGPYMKP